jgi:hypothetical protein
VLQQLRFDIRQQYCIKQKESSLDMKLVQRLDESKDLPTIDLEDDLMENEKTKAKNVRDCTPSP